MVFPGYFVFSNRTLINSEATERYVANQAPGMGFIATVRSNKIHLVEEVAPYESPALDHAEWFNVNDPSTTEFFGLYPLDITGIGNSTLTAGVTEAVRDGGTIGQARETSRSIRVRGVLVATNELSAESGLSWLRNSLRVEECSQEDSCGASDVTVFLAEPDVCAEAFGDAETGSVKESYGSFTSGTVSRRWSTDEVPIGMPSRVKWTGTAASGTTFVYGAKSRTGDTVIEQFGPVTAGRINWVTNPSFHTGVAGWAAINGGAPAWVLGDGVDGRGYAHVDTTAWDSSASNVFGSNVFGTGVFGDGGSVYGEGVYGNYIYGASSPGGAGTPGITTVAAVPAGPFVASISVRGQGVNPVTVQAVDPVSGTLLATTSFTASATWDRFSITGTAGANGVALQILSVDGVDVDEAMVESGVLLQSYFDGSGLAGNGETASWLGVPDQSPSTTGWSGVVEFSRDDSDYRPFIELLQGHIDNLTLEWFTRAPLTMDEQLIPYERTFHDVRCTQGVQVLNRYGVDGGYFIEVDFILVAGNPHAFSIPKPVTTVPVTSTTYTDPILLEALDDLWLYDPDCLVPSPPPRPPQPVLDCLDTVSSWQRYYIAVPADDVSSWAASVPTIGINSRVNPITQVRVRFHPNPFGYAAQEVDPLAFCSEFVVSYLPAQTRLALNGATERAVASKGGKATVAADHLLYGSDGGPMTWPELSCGIPYVMTLDIPADSSIDDVSVDLTMTLRE